MSDPAQQPQHTWEMWADWSMISASNRPGFVVWLTGLPGTGKRTLAQAIRQVLLARGYRAEIVDRRMLTRRFLHGSAAPAQQSQAMSWYGVAEDEDDALLVFLCAILARNGIVAITTSAMLDQRGRNHAHEHIHQLIQVYLHCSLQQRRERLQQRESPETLLMDLPDQPLLFAELNIDTTDEFPERSALRIISYLERNGYIAPLWETPDTEDEEISSIKARLQALGYLE